MSAAEGTDPAAAGPDPDTAAGPDPDRADAAARAAAARAIEVMAGRDFTTFRCGCGEPASMRWEPARVREAFGIDARNRLRRMLETAWPQARFDLVAPEVVVDALPDALDATVIIAPLYVAGRYRKLARGISQTVFHCRLCKGRGRARGGSCERCGGSGRLTPESVEDFVRPAIQEAAGGDTSAFHGAGREDVDVRMLGDGRPFVVTVERPRTRAPGFRAVEERVAALSGGRVEARDLRVIGREAKRRLTTEHGEKSYRAVVAAAPGAAFPSDAPARLAALTGLTVSQRTPRRVDDRRADLVRTRRILAVEIEEWDASRIVVALRTEPGTYVKELVTGDAGRTEPSAASLLGVACTCAELDVLAVGDGPGTADVMPRAGRAT